jgi:phosphatidylglycerol---prolipoprotein diacylglyceryl transferase
VPTLFSILAYIPSPSDNAIGIGGVQLRAYGLAIALGVLAAVWIARVRWAARGGDPDDINRIAVWAVFAGLVGARLYHVLTDLDRFEGRWLHVFAVWEGGLGIPGGLIAGVATGAYVAHRRHLPVPELLDVAAPALPVAQAIGRLGNWFNQELFGRPTDLPWGLKIDPEHRPPGYLDQATFHPTFLYEALWNLALAGGLIWWERRHPGARPGRLFAFYVAGYAVGRAWVESLRIDPAAHLLGVRWNIWMSGIAFFGAVGWLIYDSWPARQKADQEPAAAEVAELAATAETAETAETADTADQTADESGDGAGQPDTAEAGAEVAATTAAEEPGTEAEEDAPAEPEAAGGAEEAAESAVADQPDGSEARDVAVANAADAADAADDTADGDERSASPAGGDADAAEDDERPASPTGGDADAAEDDERPASPTGGDADAAEDDDQPVSSHPGGDEAPAALGPDADAAEPDPAPPTEHGPDTEPAPPTEHGPDTEPAPPTEHGPDTGVRTGTADEEAAT